MAIDTTEPYSPGWWIAELSRELHCDLPRFNAMWDRYEGRGPLPEGAESHEEIYRDFQRKACTNYAELIIRSLRQRIRYLGVRTAADDDTQGDEKANEITEASGFRAQLSDAMTWAFVMSRAYLMVGPPDEDHPEPIITAEDPRQVITRHDVRDPRKVIAALKMFHDDTFDLDLIYLYLAADEDHDQARVFVATRSRKSRQPALFKFAAGSFDWDDERGGEDGDELDVPHVPIVRMLNHEGVGEFERHTPLLDRLDHQVFQRMCIATMQAFRQRAVIDLPEEDEDGNKIDYSEVFKSGIGAMWKLPGGVTMWESQLADLGPLVTADKSDVQKLAAVTERPLHLFSPDAQNGSAEGAALSNDQIVRRSNDTIDVVVAEAVKDVMVLTFLFVKDVERAKRSKIEPMFEPPDRQSLAERSDAFVKWRSAGVSMRTSLQECLRFSPEDVNREIANIAAESFLSLPTPTDPQPTEAPVLDGATT